MRRYLKCDFCGDEESFAEVYHANNWYLIRDELNRGWDICSKHPREEVENFKIIKLLEK